MTARKQDHNKGKILDCSIKSEYDLMQRCHIEEFTGCWIWRGTFARGSARVYVRLPGSEKGNVRYMVSNKINARKRAKLTPELVREARALRELSPRLAPDSWSPG